MNFLIAFYIYNFFISPRFGVRVNYKNKIYEVVPFIKPNKNKTYNNTKEKSVYRPPMDHYYKSWNPKVKVDFSESDNEILEMLYNIFYEKYA